jgi:hypothetical protein
MYQFKLGRPIYINGDVHHLKDFLFRNLIDVQKTKGIEKILFIDTLNCLNVHEIGTYEPNQLEFYRNIFCVRTGRPYDLWARLSKCEAFIKFKKIEALFIPSLTHLFKDSDKQEIRPLLHHILSKIRYLTKKYNLLTFIGVSGSEDENILEAHSYLSHRRGEHLKLAVV